ncbi:MAG: hypothetical protein PHY90_10835, partial [Desulfitobacteriaceae bacterium]|nr:hypothetical protein [Desulfitobacteriaceae bacterium]
KERPVPLPGKVAGGVRQLASKIDDHHSARRTELGLQAHSCANVPNTKTLRNERFCVWYYIKRKT